MMFSLLAAIVALNQDSSQFQCEFPSEKMTEQGAVEYFDSVAKKGVTHFLICPNGHNAVYDSKVWDTLWHDGSAQGLTRNDKDRYMTYSKLLADRGVDFVGVWIRRARERGISPWLTMRMNDVHFIGKAETTWRSKFWCEHPEFRRVPGDDGNRQGGDPAALDFAHPEVRARALALFREMLERWDVDGIECDWLRFPHNVSPEEEKAATGHRHLTAFMREARAIVDRQARIRGHAILIGARVASRPSCAFGLGTDAETWSREGLVDWLVPCNFFQTLDFALPMDEWVKRIHAANPKVKVLAGCDFAGVIRDATFNGWSPAGITLAETAGYFERLVEGGAQGAYYFNRFTCNEKNPVDRFVQIEGVPMDGERLRRMDRAYVVTRLDAHPEGSSNLRQLPVAAAKGGAFAIPIGKAGRLTKARVRVVYTGKVAVSSEAVALNGVAATAVRPIDAIKWTNYHKDTRELSAYEFEFPATAATDGENRVTVAPIAGSSEKLGACELYLDVDR